MGDTTTKKVEQLGGQAAWPKMRLDKFATFAALVVLLIVFSIVAKNFFTVRNLLTLALQTSTITLMGIGVTFIIITGGIDLSIGSAIALTGTIAVMAADAGLGIWQSMVIGLLTGAACGLLNGLLVTRLRLPPFIATLGTMMIYRGLVLTVTNANSKPAPDAFGILGNNTLFRMTQQTPDGTHHVSAGQSMLGHPPDTPMQVSSSGSSDLAALVMFVTDATKPFSSPATMP